VTGFVTVISDGILSGFITLLEVAPEDQNKGIGHSLINQLMDDIGDLYMVDLVCTFLRRVGLRRHHRNVPAQLRDAVG